MVVMATKNYEKRKLKKNCLFIFYAFLFRLDALFPDRVFFYLQIEKTSSPNKNKIGLIISN